MTPFAHSLGRCHFSGNGVTFLGTPRLGKRNRRTEKRVVPNVETTRVRVLGLRLGLLPPNRVSDFQLTTWWCELACDGNPSVVAGNSSIHDDDDEMHTTTGKLAVAVAIIVVAAVVAIVVETNELQQTTMCTAVNHLLCIFFFF